MRLCPSVEGSASPLITHRIGTEVCQARQASNFHKCHRCIYRGKPAAWEPETPPLAMINVHAAEEPAQFEVKTVEISRPKVATQASGKPAAATKTAGTKAAGAKTTGNASKGGKSADTAAPAAL